MSPPQVGRETTRLTEGVVLTGRERRLSEADVAGFVALTGDRHPLHRPSEAARRSPWGEPIAPGLLVLCCSIGLVEIDLERVIALHALREAVFVKPVRFGETIQVEAQVACVRPFRPGVQLVGLRWLVRDQARSVLVRARVELLWDEGS
jgi:acyl dehydratase